MLLNCVHKIGEGTHMRQENEPSINLEIEITNVLLASCLFDNKPFT
jgi:hypothetical protein